MLIKAESKQFWSFFDLRKHPTHLSALFAVLFLDHKGAKQPFHQTDLCVPS